MLRANTECKCLVIVMQIYAILKIGKKDWKFLLLSNFAIALLQYVFHAKMIFSTSQKSVKNTLNSVIAAELIVIRNAGYKYLIEVLKMLR